MKNTKIQTVRFPVKRLIIGSLLGGILTHIQMLEKLVSVGGVEALQDAPGISGVIVCIALTCVIALIPISIAYVKGTKSREKIYWLTFFAQFLPFGTLGIIIATVWGLFDKKDG